MCVYTWAVTTIKYGWIILESDPYKWRKQYEAIILRRKFLLTQQQ